MIRILRKVVGGESWPVRSTDWEVWDEQQESVEDALSSLACYIDIHECDGDPASVWRIEVDGEVVHEVDARNMTSEERASVPDDVREEGHAIFGEMIKDKIDEALKKIEDKEKGS